MRLMLITAVALCLAGNFSKAQAVTVDDIGSTVSGGNSAPPCYRLSDVSVTSDGYVQATFSFVDLKYYYGSKSKYHCQSVSKKEVYFVRSDPRGKIRGVKGIEGSQAKTRFSISVEPDTKGLFVEMAGRQGNLAQRHFGLTKYIAAAKRQMSGWQTAWKRSERSLQEGRHKDKTPPKIVLTSPDVTPSRRVFRVDRYQAFIRGQVKDESGVLTVLVNGKRVRVSEDGSFAGKIKLALGKNTIKVQAEDVGGNISEREFIIVREEFIPEDTLADVDMPPQRPGRNSQGLGVVIGVESYQYVPAATYAYNDAEVVREYFAETLGFRKDRLKLITNSRATQAEFERLLGSNGWLARNTVKGKSDVVVYFSGHGIPDPATKRLGLLPFDVDPNYSIGFPLAALYRNLAGLGARSVTVVLDACFSGQSREKKLLLADARGIVVSPKQKSPSGFTILAAARGSQISGAVKEKEHGLFTYHLLAGLGGKADANKDRRLTVGELAKYVSREVRKQAAALGWEQTPTFNGNAERLLVSW